MVGGKSASQGARACPRGKKEHRKIKTKQELCKVEKQLPTRTPRTPRVTRSKPRNAGRRLLSLTFWFLSFLVFVEKNLQCLALPWTAYGSSSSSSLSSSSSVCLDFTSLSKDSYIFCKKLKFIVRNNKLRRIMLEDSGIFSLWRHLMLEITFFLSLSSLPFTFFSDSYPVKTSLKLEWLINFHN